VASPESRGPFQRERSPPYNATCSSLLRFPRDSAEVVEAGLHSLGDHLEFVKLMVEFEKETLDDDVTYRIMAQAEFNENMAGGFLSVISFLLKISTDVEDLEEHTQLWDNIGWRKIQMWLIRQAVVNFNQHGEVRDADEALRIHRDLRPLLPEMAGVHAESVYGFAIDSIQVAYFIGFPLVDSEESENSQDSEGS
jgi:hypothetical protein